MNDKWWKDAVVYQIYPRSFMDSNGDGVGDLNGIRSRLDYLKELGVDVIWMCPVYRSPNDDNGYDISDYRQIQEDFGTMDDFDALLNDIHAHGMKLIMDLVVNHCSIQHPWFTESRSSKDNPKRDWFIWKPARIGESGEKLPPNNWGSRFQGPAWEYDETTGEYFLHIFTKKMPDLNWECEELREEVFDTMRWWGEKGIDGFRMDVITSLSKDQNFPDSEKLNAAGYGDGSAFYFTGPREHEFLREMHDKVISRFDWMTVGEGVGIGPEEVADYAGYDREELDEMFHFDHIELMQGPLGKWTTEKPDLVKLKAIFNKWQTALEGKAWDSLFWENHDYTRVVSRFGNDSPEWRELSAKMLAVSLYMMRGTPYIYQGQELGMTNFKVRDLSQLLDVESINAFHAFTEAGKVTPEQMLRCIEEVGRDQSRTPMQWDDSEQAGFTKGTPWMAVNPNYTEINAAEQKNRPDSVLNFYKKMLKVRRENETVLRGSFELLMPEDKELFVYTRTLGGSKVLVACNYSGSERELTLPEPLRKMGGCLMLENYEETKKKEFCSGEALVLRPYEAAVWSLS